MVAREEPEIEGTSSKRSDGVERWLVRVATAGLFVAAVWITVALKAPEKLPGVALGQESVFQAEVLLALIYAGLLLLTPLFYGLLRGRVPIEISHRGAKWAVEAEEKLARAEDALAKGEATIAGSMSRSSWNFDGDPDLTFTQ